MVRFNLRCPDCDVAIRASVRLIGRRQSCPGCGRPLLVRPQPPEGSPALLVLLDGTTTPAGAGRQA